MGKEEFEKKKFPPLHQIVTLVFLTKDGKKNIQKGLVDFIGKNGRLKIKLPLHFDTRQIPANAKVSIEYTRSDAQYILTAETDSFYHPPETISKTTSPLLILKNPLQIERNQRRQYYRLKITIPIWYRKISLPVSYEKDESVRRQYLGLWKSNLESIGEQGESLDLSAGGIQLLTNTKFKENDAVFMKIQKEGINIHSTGIVRRTAPAKSSSNYDFNVGIEFIGLDDQQKTQIIKFVNLEEQKRQKHLFI